MPAYPPLLPLKIHPFWLTLGYGIFVGYEIRKYHIDEKIAKAIRTRQDAVTRRQASILLDEAEKRAAVVLRPETVREAVAREKAAHGTEG
jgi:hypothetical protein